MDRNYWLNNQERREDKETHTQTELLRSIIQGDFPGEGPQPPEPQPQTLTLYLCQRTLLCVRMYVPFALNCLPLSHTYPAVGNRVGVLTELGNAT